MQDTLGLGDMHSTLINFFIDDFCHFIAEVGQLAIFVCEISKRSVACSQLKDQSSIMQTRLCKNQCRGHITADYQNSRATECTFQKAQVQIPGVSRGLCKLGNSQRA